MLPHFNFMSLDKVRLHDSFGGGQIQAPSFFDRDFSVFHHATFESPSHADRPKIIAEFKKSNVLRGVKLLTIPKSQDNANWGLMARYGGYKSVNAAATWGATQGMYPLGRVPSFCAGRHRTAPIGRLLSNIIIGADILGEYGKYKARKWDRNSSTVPSPKIYSEIEKLDDPDSDLRATIEGIFQSEVCGPPSLNMIGTGGSMSHRLWSLLSPKCCAITRLGMNRARRDDTRTMTVLPATGSTGSWAMTPKTGTGVS